MQIPDIIQTISKALVKENAQAIVVGGAVRDHFMGTRIKDYDVEVYGLTHIEQLERILAQYGTVNLVGKSFGIFKFRYEKEEYDFAFPRTEQKNGVGHRGFDIQCDGSLTFEEASVRRDFTINAMGYDIEAEQFLDPHGGQRDMERRVLRHVDDQTFVEDPLRLYRAVQFAARFGYRLDEHTFELCRSMVEAGMLAELAAERIYMEFYKLLLQSPKPSIGFELMRELGILRYFPELEAIVGVPQSPKWHPEGDVWVHTLMVVDQMAALKVGDTKEDLKLMLAALCHDLGKATHTQIGEEKITAIGHEEAGVGLSKRFLYRLTNEHELIKAVGVLVREHLQPSIYFHNRAKDKTIRRLATRVNIEELVRLARADFLGRTTEASLSGRYEAGDWLLEQAKRLDVLNTPPMPLLQGRDLIELGYPPSRAFKPLLHQVYQAQINGTVKTREEAIAYVTSQKINLN